MRKAELEQFRGSEKWYRYPYCTPTFLFTEGVHHVVEGAEALWLVTDIASYQPQLQGHPLARHFQGWKLTVPGRVEGETGFLPAVLTCVADDGETLEEVVRQEYHVSNFPLAEIDIWVEAGSINEDGELGLIAMLPSER